MNVWGWLNPSAILFFEHRFSGSDRLQIRNTGSHIPLFKQTEILHTLIRMGSAALAAAVPAVSYPGKETRVSCKGNIEPHIIK